MIAFAPIELASDEITVDLFAGGGGASTGIEWATGRSPDIAVNHDPEALALHAANHPRTQHYRENVWSVDPVRVCRGRRVALLWLSPDCKDFSKAKNGVPVSKKVRCLAWAAVRWAKAVMPTMIFLENVEEFAKWGPISRATRKPDPKRRGHTFRAFVRKLERLGYAVEHRLIRASDHGSPTIRRRLYLIARRDGQPIVWPAPTYGPGRAQPHRTAAGLIDWSIPCPSIFDRKKPLAEKTLRRIAAGLKRYVIDSPTPFLVSYYGAKRDGGERTADLAQPLPTVPTENRFGLVEPFLVPMSHANRPTSLHEPMQTITTQGNKFNVVAPLIAPITHGGERRCLPASEPLPTITTANRGELAIVAPTLVQTGYGEREGQAPRALDIEQPLGTVVGCGQKHALVSAYIAKHFGDRGQRPGISLFEPVSTVTSTDHHALVASSLVKLHGSSKDGQPLNVPLHTVFAGGTHHAEVRAFLTAYYTSDRTGGASLFAPMRTVMTKDRIGLVTVEGQLYAIADIGMRMLSPRELYRAQGFPDSYLIDIEFNGKPLTKTAQVRMAGNSVCPHVAAALVHANLGVAAPARRWEPRDDSRQLDLMEVA